MQQLHVEYLQPPEPIEEHVDTRALRRRALEAIGLLAVLALVALFAPGLGEVRSKLSGADPGWLVVGAVLEALSCASYVVMFRPVFCDRMTWRSATELGLSELAIGSIVPASGAAGLALGAWALRKSGMPALQIAERSVAFFTLKSAANFIAVAILGVLMFAGVGPPFSPRLTILPAGLAIISIVAVAALPRLLREPERLAARGGWRAAVAKGATATRTRAGRAGGRPRRR